MRPHTNYVKCNSFGVNSESFSDQGLNNTNFASEGQLRDFGRKRNNEVSSKCMYDMIYFVLIPKWQKYLKNKSERNMNS